MPTRTRTRAAVTVLAALTVASAPGLAETRASASPAQPPAASGAAPDYCQGRCHDVLPPGENGNATLADIIANKVLGTRPPHTDDQLGRYDRLLDGYRG